MGKSFEYFSVPLRHSPLSINMPTEIFPFLKKKKHSVCVECIAFLGATSLQVNGQVER